ncbi:hypothetical protein GMES_3400 [Paraglaciecola mesophila KMM 241]|uniref:Uncharacterized protein n=1 Tax=Paraglaciecola mesophila KMM 241 TaxID=1128912 RepID=K6Z5K9_9ALTE|nr:hypothetical protein GMES_3400 [Paraglaciecola mesophila KMM 241]
MTAIDNNTLYITFMTFSLFRFFALNQLPITLNNALNLG